MELCTPPRGPYKVIAIQQGTEAWHDWRDKGLGASDAPTIMGENPWKSATKLLEEKLRKFRATPNKAMLRGTALEPEARRLYERTTGISVFPSCLQSTKYDWLLASVDGLANDGSSVVEIKCGYQVHKHAASTHQVPTYYIGQVQQILAVTGLAVLDFWCYLLGQPQVHLQVARDNEYIERLLEVEQRFWEKLQNLKD